MEGEVCIIGAGPAGVVTGRVFQRDGYDVTIYEKYDEIGGTWSSERRYVDLNAQADRGLLEFSEKPHDTAFMDAEDVQNYLQEYAAEFGVAERIRFGTAVVDLQQGGDGWQVTVETDDGAVTESYDYVVVCSGVHHDPHVPDVPGEADFEGETYHSTEVDSADALDGRDVATVGFGKSALDLSIEAARGSGASTLVFRKARWHLPRKLLLGTLRFQYLLFSRFGESLLPRYHNDAAVRLLDRLPWTVKNLLWKAITVDMKRSARLHTTDESLVPDEQLPHALHRVGVYPPDFVDFVNEGKITPKQAGIERFEADGLRLDTGETVEADVVVWGTGFEHEFPFLTDDVELVTGDGHPRAYRRIVPPGTDGLGFVGLRQAFNNFLSMEVSAHWLSAYFAGELDRMPSEAEMEAAIERRIDWRERLPGTDGFGPVPYDVHLVDALLDDLGIPTNQAANPLAEYFLPVWARRYDDLHEQREAKRSVAAGETRRTLRDRAMGTARWVVGTIERVIAAAR